MTLKTAVENLKKSQLLADSVVAGDLRTRPGRMEQRRQAQIALPQLKEKLKAEFKKVAVPIFLTGENAGAFAKAITEVSAEALVVDLDSVTADIRRATKAAIGNVSREFNPHVFSVLTRELKQLGYAMGLKSIPAPNFQDSTYVKSDEKFKALVDQYLYEDTGPEFVASVVEYAAGLEAVRTLTGDEELVPVVVVGLPPKLVDAVGARTFGGNFYRHTPAAETDVGDVEALLNAVKRAANEQTK